MRSPAAGRPPMPVAGRLAGLFGGGAPMPPCQVNGWRAGGGGIAGMCTPANVAATSARVREISSSILSRRTWISAAITGDGGNASSR